MDKLDSRVLSPVLGAISWRILSKRTRSWVGTLYGAELGITHIEYRIDTLQESVSQNVKSQATSALNAAVDVSSLGFGV